MNSSTCPLWTHPPALPSHTCVSHNVMNALLLMNGRRVAGVVERLRDLPLFEWPLTAVNFLDQADDDVLLAADAAGNDVRVGISTVPGAGRGVFALRDFQAGETLLPFWGPLVYEDLSAAALSGDPELQNTLYGSGISSTTSLRWLKTAADVHTSRSFWTQTAWRPSHFAVINEYVNTKHCRPYCACMAHHTCPAFVVPADTCAAGMVNDRRLNTNSDSGDTPAAAAKRQSNAILAHRKYPVCSSKDVTRADAVHLLLTLPIRMGEEFFLDYGREHACM